MMTSTNIPSAVWKEAADVFSLITDEASQHVLSRLSDRRDMTSDEIAGNGISKDRCQRVLRRMESIRLVRKGRFGNEVHYNLNHDTLDRITAAASIISTAADRGYRATEL
jgi:hypothetical protein